jgi:hypothetical protein
MSATIEDRRFGSKPMPERSLQQRMDALAAANVIRVKRKELKWDLKAGRASLVDVLLEPIPAWLDTMKVWDLLVATPKWGRVKTNKTLVQCRISPSKTVGGLSDRQRSELAGMVRR